MPRVSLVLLPGFALFVGRTAEWWWNDERPPVAALAAMAVLTLWLATRQQTRVAASILLIGNGLLVGATGLRAGTAAAALAVALLAAAPLLPIRLEVGRSVTAQYLDPMVDWLRAHRQLISGPVLTNSQLLSAYAERRLSGVDVRFVVPIEMSRDLTLLSNPANEQQARIRDLCTTDLYGRTLSAPITPDDVPAGSLLALRVESRLPLLLPEAVWGGRLDVLEDTPQFRIARVVPAPAGAAPSGAQVP
jgi:hypothetical protein